MTRRPRNSLWLRHQQRRLRAALEEKAPSRDLDIERIPDAIEAVNLRNQRNLTASLNDAWSARARKINDALERIKRGEYGTCELCGEEIPDARLDAIPWADTCCTCADLKETYSCQHPYEMVRAE